MCKASTEKQRIKGRSGGGARGPCRQLSMVQAKWYRSGVWMLCFLLFLPSFFASTGPFSIYWPIAVLVHPLRHASSGVLCIHHPDIPVRRARSPSAENESRCSEARKQQTHLGSYYTARCNVWRLSHSFAPSLPRRSTSRRGRWWCAAPIDRELHLSGSIAIVIRVIHSARLANPITFSPSFAAVQAFPHHQCHWPGWATCHGRAPVHGRGVARLGPHLARVCGGKIDLARRVTHGYRAL
jgi:hypothetical protein